MNDPLPAARVAHVAALAAVADRLDGLADAAELVGDVAGAEGWREKASTRRLQAMALLPG